jgi:hypothetical protein
VGNPSTTPHLACLYLDRMKCSDPLSSLTKPCSRSPC